MNSSTKPRPAGSNSGWAAMRASASSCAPRPAALSQRIEKHGRHVDALHGQMSFCVQPSQAQNAGFIRVHVRICGKLFSAAKVPANQRNGAAIVKGKTKIAMSPAVTLRGVNCVAHHW